MWTTVSGYRREETGRERMKVYKKTKTNFKSTGTENVKLPHCRERMKREGRGGRERQ